jgi:hypothetical protein
VSELVRNGNCRPIAAFLISLPPALSSLAALMLYFYNIGKNARTYFTELYNNQHL